MQYFNATLIKINCLGFLLSFCFLKKITQSDIFIYINCTGHVNYCRLSRMFSLNRIYFMVSKLYILHPFSTLSFLVFNECFFFICNDFFFWFYGFYRWSKCALRQIQPYRLVKVARSTRSFGRWDSFHITVVEIGVYAINHEYQDQMLTIFAYSNSHTFFER